MFGFSGLSNAFSILHYLKVQCKHLFQSWVRQLVVAFGLQHEVDDSEGAETIYTVTQYTVTHYTVHRLITQKVM
jgi:hypothetical protein